MILISVRRQDTIREWSYFLQQLMGLPILHYQSLRTIALVFPLWPSPATPDGSVRLETATMGLY